MTAAISYIITAISTVALLALWFINAYQVIISEKQDLIQAEEQVRLLHECYNAMRNSPDETSAGRMLETSIQIYTEIEKSYNETLRETDLQGTRIFDGVSQSRTQQVEKEEEG